MINRDIISKTTLTGFLRISLRISLAVSLLVLVGIQSTYATDKNTQENLRLKAINTLRYTLPVDGLNSSANQSPSAGTYLGAATSTSNLGCTPGSQDATRGLTVGCTFYDFQRNGSMNRIIAINDPGHFLNFTWTNQDNNSATGGRNVKYEGFDHVLGELVDGTSGVDIGGDLIPPNRSGFTSIDILGSWGTVSAHHWDQQFGAGGTFNSWIFYHTFIGEFNGQRIDTAVIGCCDLVYANPLWPRVAYTNDGLGTEVTHLVGHGGRQGGIVGGPIGRQDEAHYLRKVGVGQSGIWTPTMLIGQGGYHLSAAITASRKPGSQNVVIAGSFSRGDGTALGGFQSLDTGSIPGKSDNDIYYMESTDAGENWGPLTNVTMRQDSLPGGFAPHTKLDVLYDQSDNFHIVWQAMKWNGYEGPFTPAGRMLHYDPASDEITTVHDFVWSQTMCNGGFNNLNATNPQISECDGKLYVTFEQFNDIPAGIEDDCSERAPESFEGAANGDIYVTVSDNGGSNWDLRRNLTATYTPDCDTLPGGAKPDCDSDVWHSTTRYGVDIDTNNDDFDAIADLSANIGGYVGPNYLFVQYINDSDPGGAIKEEGSWTNSSVRVFRFGCIEPQSGARLASSLTQTAIIAVDTLAISGHDSTLTWELLNIGDVDINDLTVTLSGVAPPGQISLSTFATTLLASEANNATGFITLNATQDSSVTNASATITVAGTFANAPLTFTLSYSILKPPCCTVAGDYNHDGSFNISDVTSGINRIFGGGPPPFCGNEADFNADGAFGIADVTGAINHIFHGGPAPICGNIRE